MQRAAAERRHRKPVGEEGAPTASTLKIPSNVDSAVSPGTDAGTRHQDIDTAPSVPDNIEHGIRGFKVACVSGNGRRIATEPRRGLVGVPATRETTTVTPCAANSCADAKPIPPLPRDTVLHTLSLCGTSHTAAVDGGLRELVPRARQATGGRQRRLQEREPRFNSRDRLRFRFGVSRKEATRASKSSMCRLG